MQADLLRYMALQPFLCDIWRNLSPRYRLQVYQTISEGRLNNVVELYGRYNLPALPGVNVEPIVATATLKHMLRVSGVRRLEITFEDTELKATGACLKGLLVS